MEGTARLLVTGVTGYLGSAFTHLLVQQGYCVRALVRTPKKVARPPTSVEIVPGDLADEASLRRAAALGGTPAETRRSNTEDTRAVHTSSSAAIIDASGLVSEQAANRTALVDPYLVTKAEAEGLVLAAVREGLDARIVTVVNAYGPSPAGSSSYNQLFPAVMRGEVPVIVDARVSWVLAEDVTRGHLLASERHPHPQPLSCMAGEGWPKAGVRA